MTFLLHHLVIFKDSVNFFMLSTGLLMQGQIFADSHRHCAMRERVVVKMGTFGVKGASDEKVCPIIVLYLITPPHIF